MRKMFGVVALWLVFAMTPAVAQNTWAGNLAQDFTDEQNACYGDAQRFCGGNTIFVFEMENCLKRNLASVSKPCRKLLSPTNFKTYYQEEAHPFDFLK